MDETTDASEFATENVGSPNYCRNLLYAIARGDPLPPAEHGVKFIDAIAAGEDDTQRHIRPCLPRRVLPAEKRSRVELYVMVNTAHSSLLEGRVPAVSVSEEWGASDHQWKVSGPQPGAPEGCDVVHASAYFGASKLTADERSRGTVEYDSYTLIDPIFSHYGLVTYQIKARLPPFSFRSEFALLTKDAGRVTKDKLIPFVDRMKEAADVMQQRANMDTGNSAEKNSLTFRSKGAVSTVSDAEERGEGTLPKMCRRIDKLRVRITALKSETDLAGPGECESILADISNIGRSLFGRSELHVLVASFDDNAVAHTDAGRLRSPLKLDEEFRRLYIDTAVDDDRDDEEGQKRHAVMPTYVPNATREKLVTKLEDAEQVDIFVFSGHGHEVEGAPVIDMKADDAVDARPGVRPARAARPARPASGDRPARAARDARPAMARPARAARAARPARPASGDRPARPARAARAARPASSSCSVDPDELVR